MQGTHSAAPALLAKQSRFPRRMKGRLCSKGGPASGTSIKLRKPASETYRPKRKVTQRQLPCTRTFDFANGEQKQPEHRFGRFMLRQNLLRNLADYREPRTQLVIALRLVKRFEQLALLNPHQIPRLFFNV